MIKNEAQFQERYQKLNEKQKEAVDTLQGPVMVIAGPGTGKTEILSMRIAQLLRSDAQVKPNEILCLTYTDEGSVAMRKRLLQIIGEDAHRVYIYTFHAFCNNIIQNNAEYFGLREVQPVTDLERTAILHSLLEDLPEGNVLRKLKGQIFFDARNLYRLFELMKTESWTVEDIRQAVQAHLEALPENPEYIYQRNGKDFKKGDLKQSKIDEETRRMQRTLAAAELFPEYQQRMQAMGRYDFSDMILWVLNAFKQNEDFLRNYQERFQYVLVDEFQDTSGAQSDLLHTLMDFWETPNLFIVGDDDQSIFEFQGARLKNIVDFHTKYSNVAPPAESIKLIVLKENYRSSQQILDIATKLIDHNRQRLIRKLEHLQLDKHILSANKRFQAEEPVAPVTKAYFNILHEEADIVRQIEQLQEKGVALHNVAVLYAQHKQAANIISLLEHKGIPYWVKNPENILDLPFIQQIINMLRYIEAELHKPLSGEALLFQIMHVPFLGISPADAAELALWLQHKDSRHKNLRFALSDGLALAGLGLESVQQMQQLGHCIDDLLRNARILTMPMLLEKLIYQTHIGAYCMSSNDQVWLMQVLHTFFSFVIDESSRQPRLTLSGFLKMIDDMTMENIAIPIQKVVRQENGVRFYTAFGAKGHEFEYVFLVGCTKKYWEEKKSNNSGFTLPADLTQSENTEEASDTEEVMRRVFYVAVTRAKKYLQVSYALRDNAGKDLEASRFVSEINPEAQLDAEQHIAALDNASLMKHIEWAVKPSPPVNIQLVRKELLDRRLETFALSASTLNSYLKCPVSFYYEQILRVPTAKSDALAFGIAIHYALEKLFKKMQEHPEKHFPVKEELISDFEKMMWREQDAFTELQYKRRRELGANILGEYYDQYIDSFNKVVSVERNFNNIQVAGVPIKGKIDKIEFDGSDCSVIDYKTGNPEYSQKKELLPPNDKAPDGGNYWRQMVFYKILLEASPEARLKGWKMKEGIFDYIEKEGKRNEYIRHIVPITPDDVAIVKTQIKDTYTRIMNHEFDKGCEKEDCTWCNFVRTNELALPLPLTEEI